MDTSLYRTVWRWHFYAGLIVLPVLVWLAVTGGLYLYKPEIERLVYGGWIESGRTGPPLAIAEMIGAVERQTGGQITQIARPAGAESWRMEIEGQGGSLTAFVRPDTGQVLGTMPEGGVMEMVRRLHSLAITGPVGNALVEIVAGWTIILVLTGFYLWWPRRGSRALALRGRPRERLFWRDLHASAGVLVGAVVLFLAVTGMPWSVFWGGQLQSAVAANGLGRPKAPVAPPSAKDGHGEHGAADHLPWSLRKAEPPPGAGTGDLGPDRMIRIAEAAGLRAPYTLRLPGGAGGAYTISRTAERADEARAIYLEAATGRVLADYHYAEFGAGARAIEWGIYTHQGQQYGELNRLVMLAGCIGVILLAVSAPVLWWKRRSAGRLREPPAPKDPFQAKGVTAIMLSVGALFPLTGATMLAALVLERLLESKARSA